MNRRGFLASLVALAVAPVVKVTPKRRIVKVGPWQGPLRPFDKPFPCALDPDLDQLRRLVRVPSFGEGGMIPKIS